VDRYYAGDEVRLLTHDRLDETFTVIDQDIDSYELTLSNGAHAMASQVELVRRASRSSGPAVERHPRAILIASLIVGVLIVGTIAVINKSSSTDKNNAVARARGALAQDCGVHLDAISSHPVASAQEPIGSASHYHDVLNFDVKTDDQHTARYRVVMPSDEDSFQVPITSCVDQNAPVCIALMPEVASALGVPPDNDCSSG
jgi:hypothetical protein